MRSMSSSVEFQDQAVRNYLNAVKQNIVNPDVEVYKTRRFIKSVVQDHFNKTESPVGRWKPSQAALKENRLTLTKTRALRDGLRFKVNITKLNGVKIDMIPSEKTKKYAYTHNNGLSVRIFGRNYYHFPKRQYAWLSNNDKKIIEDIWLGVFD